MLIDTSPLAMEDIINTIAWYEFREYGLGKSFFAMTIASTKNIKTFPYMHPIILDNVRRVKVKNFSHNLYYVVENQSIIILRCLHNSADFDSARLK